MIHDDPPPPRAILVLVALLIGRLICWYGQVPDDPPPRAATHVGFPSSLDELDDLHDELILRSRLSASE